MNESKPFHVRVAEALIEQLKTGTAPWQRPWADGVPALPMNPVTGARYRGINTLQLLLQDHTDPRWMTYRHHCSAPNCIRWIWVCCRPAPASRASSKTV